jgi:hypothetical protein
MRSKILLSMTIVLALLVVSAVAADVTGKWTSERQGRDGQPSITTYTFKAEGAKLTGTVTMPGFMGGEPTNTEITEGKIDGNNISFVVVRKMDMQGQSMEMKSTYKGVVAGDEIKFTVERPAMGGPGGGAGGGGGFGGAPGGGGPGGGAGGPGGGMGGGRGMGGPQEIIAKRAK